MVFMAHFMGAYCGAKEETHGAVRHFLPDFT
jgi:hypothetical protein